MTNETAQTILASDKPDFIPGGHSAMVDAAMEKYFANYHTDLQRMAKLWLAVSENEKPLQRCADCQILGYNIRVNGCGFTG